MITVNQFYALFGAHSRGYLDPRQA